jgi:hypothetical protein
LIHWEALCGSWLLSLAFLCFSFAGCDVILVYFVIRTILGPLRLLASVLLQWLSLIISFVYCAMLTPILVSCWSVGPPPPSDVVCARILELGIWKPCRVLGAFSDFCLVYRRGMKSRPPF